MKHATETIELSTSEPLQFIDITDHVREAVNASGIVNGVANVFTHHTTTAVKINKAPQNKTLVRFMFPPYG